MLDGASRIGEVVAAAAADGQPAVGITDHGNMYGVLPLYEAARDAGIKPVLGMEGYFTNTSRFDRPKRSEHEIFHLTMLAETNEGYRNLIKVTSAAYLDGYYYKPRSDWELLERHHEGISATTGCLGGLVSQLILKDEPDAALEAAARFQDIFGREHFFVELQDHGIDDDARVIRPLLDIARKLQRAAARHERQPLHAQGRRRGARRVAVRADRRVAERPEALQVRRQRLLHQERGRDARAVRRSARRVRQHVADRGARRRRDRLRPGDPARVPGAGGPRRELVPARAHDARAPRSATAPTPAPHVIERIEFELDVIKSMGFPAYFLVVWDLVRYAKSRNIRVGPGRGSAAGSCVAYCLRIVDIDPIKYDLLFERFLNPGRKQMPDIDMDFDSRYRGEMIKYAAQKYGHDHVAQIITFSTIKARAAVRDAARVLGYPYAVGDKIAKLMPPLIMGRDTPLHACLDAERTFADGYKMAADLRALYDVDPDAKRVVDVARGPRRPAPPGRHPRGRGRHHPRAAHRVPADPAQARARHRARRRRRWSRSTRCTASKSSAC